ncbi:MAG: D-aminoacylase [candidate division KSB1 bacterium]|nr:D-aminoacylase [candidate division KSB1 bacterium]
MAGSESRLSRQNNLNRRDFIRKTALGGLYGAYVIASGCAPKRDFDLLIRGGLICDGTGKDLFRADVGIKNGRIAAIGALQDKSAVRVIDADELIVAPGFIDIHSHSDDELLVDGRAHSKIRQGVTTEVLGQDGSSYAPLNDEMRQRMHERLKNNYGIDVDWQDMRGYYNKLRKQGLSVNVVSMVGAGTLRAHVVGYEDRPATSEEIARMQALLQKAIEQGARHLSSGLEYTPGSFATTEELIELCRVLGPQGVYSTHMRNEDDRVLQAVSEAIRIAREAGCKLNISHLKASGKRNWHKLDAILNLLDEARQSGTATTCDRYPYIAYSTGLTALFPTWSREGKSEDFVARLQDESLLPKIREAVLNKIHMLGDWNAVMISSMSEEPHKAYAGRRLGDLAREHNQEPFEFLRQLMIAEKGRGGMVGFAMSEENTERVLAYPYCAVASDGSARATEGPLSEGSPHPRNFGTFPRVLGYYVREKKLFSLPEAIRKMTDLPARIIGIQQRGLIAEGYFADVTLFHPEKVRDTATFVQPKQYPEGIEYVIVNGKVVIDQGEHTHRKPGKILY